MDFAEPQLYAGLHYGLHSAYYDITKRAGCISCPNTPISCPTCSTGEVCIQRAGNCTVCTLNTCVPESQSGAMSAGPPPNSGPNVGAIVGGAIGGLAAIAIATFLIWRFCIRNRRQNLEEGYEDEIYREKPGDGFTNLRNNRASTHTVASFASTALTRASNVIQIAFIPGITDSSRHEEDYVPPVPPIPIPTSEAGSRSNSPYLDATDHYFTLDVRDSQYDGFSDDGTSVADRRSVTPSLRSTTPSMFRNSVASTIYRSEAAVASATPVQTAQRGRAAVVSVKVSNPNSPSSPVPSVPSIDYQKYGGQKPQRPLSTSRSPAREDGLTSSSDSASGVSSESNKAQHLNVGGSSVSDYTSTDSTSQRLSTTGSPQLIEAIQQATRRASKQPTHGGLGSARREVSPFADSNAIPEEELASTNP